MDKNVYNIAKKIEKIKDINKLYKYAEKLERSFYCDEEDKISPQIELIRNFFHKLILKREKALCKGINKSFYPTFNNILNKKIYHVESVKKICAKFPLIDRNIGSIPKVFFKNTKNKVYTIQAIYDLFAYYSMQLNLFYNNRTSKLIESRLKEFKNELSKIIGEKVKMSYIGSGCNSNAFKIEVDKQKFCYKAFILPHLKENIFHGILAEPQMSYFATKNGTKKQFVKFFFGRVGSPFHYDAFTVSEYLERNLAYRENNRFKVDWLIITDDKPVNSINGTFVDIGSLKTKIKECKDKGVRQMVRVICRNITFKQINDGYIYNSWILTNKNFKTLQNYVRRKNYNNYKNALLAITNSLEFFPNDLKKSLLNILNLDDSYSFCKNTYFTSKNLFSTTLEDIEYSAKQFYLKIADKHEPVEEFNIPGHLLIELTNKNISTIKFDKNNQVNTIKLYEKKDNDDVLNLIYSAEGAEQILSAAQNICINDYIK